MWTSKTETVDEPIEEEEEDKPEEVNKIMMGNIEFKTPISFNQFVFCHTLKIEYQRLI